jgi:hypothetical protein
MEELAAVIRGIRKGRAMENWKAGFLGHFPTTMRISDPLTKPIPTSLRNCTSIQRLGHDNGA